MGYFQIVGKFGARYQFGVKSSYDSGDESEIAKSPEFYTGLRFYSFILLRYVHVHSITK